MLGRKSFFNSLIVVHKIRILNALILLAISALLTSVYLTPIKAAAIFNAAVKNFLPFVFAKTRTNIIN